MLLCYFLQLFISQLFILSQNEDAVEAGEDSQVDDGIDLNEGLCVQGSGSLTS